MVRNYKHKTGPRPYTREDFQAAMDLIAQGMPVHRVDKIKKIPRITLRRHVSGESRSCKVERKPALLPEEERSIVQHVAALSDQGYAFDPFELRLFVKSFVDKAGRDVPAFKENMPGTEWLRLFMKRHKDILSKRMCQKKLTREDIHNWYELVSQMVLDHLRAVREAAKPASTGRGRARKVYVDPGKSVTASDLVQPGTSKPQATGAGKRGRKRKVRQVSESSSEDADDPMSSEEERWRGEGREERGDSSDEARELSSDSDDESIGINDDCALIIPVESAGSDNEGQEGQFDSDNEGQEGQFDSDNEGQKGQFDSDNEGQEGQFDSDSEVREEKQEFDVGQYVLVSFKGKKSNFHYVGKIQEKTGEREYDVQYYRRVMKPCESFYIFKEPENQDLYPTDVKQIVKKLPLPGYIKHKLKIEASLFDNLIVR